MSKVLKRTTNVGTKYSKENQSPQITPVKPIKLANPTIPIIKTTPREKKPTSMFSTSLSDIMKGETPKISAITTPSKINLDKSRKATPKKENAPGLMPYSPRIVHNTDATPVKHADPQRKVIIDTKPVESPYIKHEYKSVSVQKKELSMAYNVQCAVSPYQSNFKFIPVSPAKCTSNPVKIGTSVLVLLVFLCFALITLFIFDSHNIIKAPGFIVSFCKNIITLYQKYGPHRWFL